MAQPLCSLAGELALLRLAEKGVGRKFSSKLHLGLPAGGRAGPARLFLTHHWSRGRGVAKPWDQAGRMRLRVRGRNKPPPPAQDSSQLLPDFPCSLIKQWGRRALPDASQASRLRQGGEMRFSSLLSSLLSWPFSGHASHPCAQAGSETNPRQRLLQPSQAVPG